MQKKNSVNIGLNASSDALEVNYNWNIPKYELKNIYSEKLKLRDDIECTIMLVPHLMDKLPGHLEKENKRFIRSYFTVFFTKVPEDDNQVFFNFNVRTQFKRRPIASAGFKKVLMIPEGYRGNRNNLNSVVWKMCLYKNRALELDIKFIIDDFSCKSFHLENFEKERSKLSSDFAVIYKEPKFTDMMLICANDEKVAVNKALLASRSPVLAEVLTNEIDTYIIGENVSKEIVDDFLRFLYTDTISVDGFEANTIELLEMSKKYEVTELARLCEKDLIDGCKDKLDEITNKLKTLSCQNISKLKNFAEISRCIKDLYKATKNINLAE